MFRWAFFTNGNRHGPKFVAVLLCSYGKYTRTETRAPATRRLNFRILIPSARGSANAPLPALSVKPRPRARPKNRQSLRRHTRNNKQNAAPPLSEPAIVKALKIGFIPPQARRIKRKQIRPDRIVTVSVSYAGTGRLSFDGLTCVSQPLAEYHNGY